MRDRLLHALGVLLAPVVLIRDQRVLGVSAGLARRQVLGVGERVSEERLDSGDGPVLNDD